MGKTSQKCQKMFDDMTAKDLIDDCQAKISESIDDETVGLSNTVKLICKNCGGINSFNISKYNKMMSRSLDTSSWKNKSYLKPALKKIIKIGQTYVENLTWFTDVEGRIQSGEKRDREKSKSRDAAKVIMEVIQKFEENFKSPENSKLSQANINELNRSIELAIRAINSLNRFTLLFQKRSGLGFLKTRLLKMMHIYKNCMIPILEFYHSKPIEDQVYCLDDDSAEMKGWNLKKFKNIQSTGNIFIIKTGEGTAYKNGITDDALLNDISSKYSNQTIGIVDAANTGGRGGGGIDGAIFNKMRQSRAKDAINQKFGEGHDLIEEGGAIVHDSFDIKDKNSRVPYVIQTVGPKVHLEADCKKLYSAYENAIKLGEQKGCGILLTGAISMGIFWKVEGEEFSDDMERKCAHMVCEIANKHPQVTLIFTDHWPRRGGHSDEFMKELSTKCGVKYLTL